MGALRAGSILAGFMVLTVPLMPVQAALVRLSPAHARRFPHWYHKKVCRLLGVRLRIEGAVERGSPVLLVSNHTSWLDIPVLSAVAPVSFVAKKEVAGWPFVSALARLQRTVFVDRERRAAAGEAAGEIMCRLDAGDTIVLFAEGTSSDGNRVLPFKTALFSAAMPPARAVGSGHVNRAAVVQTLSIVYKRLHGVPIGRADRPIVGWYGDMEMTSHAWALLKAGPLDVTIRISPPVSLEAFSDRKELAARSEAEVREHVVRILRDRPAAEPVEVAPPPEDQGSSAPPKTQSAKWR